MIKKIASSLLPTKYGTFKISVYSSGDDGREHLSLVKGDLSGKPLLTRIHSQCLTGDTLSSLKCDCGEQLKKSLNMIQKSGSGVLIYLNQEGRGIGLSNKIRAYALQDQGLDTVEANQALGFQEDGRDYQIAAWILKSLGISEIELLSNNPDKIGQLKRYGIGVKKILPLEISPNNMNRRYLATKKNKLGHFLKKV